MRHQGEYDDTEFFEDDLDGELAAEDWENEVNRHSRVYVQWVQRSLNKVLGTRLSVDGISGSKTRSAIRTFQKLFSLNVDGVVGPQTETMLTMLSFTPPPSAPSRPTGAGPSAPASPIQPTSGTVRFPSGESLPIVSGPTGEGQEHYDSNRTGNPLLDASGMNRSKKVSRNFTVGEFAQRFSHARIDPRLVQCLQKIRDHAGRPVKITSGYRSYGYNVRLYQRRGKRPTYRSRHVSGQAVDIKIPGMSGMDIAKLAIDVCGCRIGVGIGGSYAHIDVRGRWDKWTYFSGDANKKARAQIERYHRAICTRIA